MKRLTILQSITPDYRKIFFENIRNELGSKFELYSGNSYFEKSLKDDETIQKVKVKNLFLFGKVLIQSHFTELIFKEGIVIVEMNPRILTNWFILIGRKILGKKVYLWGHAWPRNGKNSKTERIRKIMKVLGNKIIVYTKQQKQELQQQLPNKSIEVASNAVINSSEMSTNNDTEKINNIIYVGRLTKLKKIMFLVKSFHSIMTKLPKNCCLIIAGSGEEHEKLLSYILENKLTEKVLLKGHVSDYKELKNLYFSSLLSVSSGYVGLSITQSFGFGVPMLVSKTENHSPEIEAFEENVNGLFFTTNDITSCGEKILSFFENKEKWVGKRDLITKACKENYSTEAMSNTFIKLVL